MAVKYLKDGEAFGPSHFSKDFGFSGSAEHDGAKPPFAADKPTMDSKRTNPSNIRPGDPSNAYAMGGHIEHHHDGRETHHHGDGTFSVHHPDGRIAHHNADGGHTMVHPDGMTVEYHAHGGHTEHHPGGMMIEHHADGGRIVHHPDGAREHHDSSELAHRSRGGDMAQDKAMVRKGIHQHEDHEHHGEHTDLHLRDGGSMPHDGERDSSSAHGYNVGGPAMMQPGQPMMGQRPMGMAKGGHAMSMGERPRVPRAMRPRAMARKTPFGQPGKPEKTVTPRQSPSDGSMPYGVEPSAEPDVAGSDQDIPQLRGGGRARR